MSLLDAGREAGEPMPAADVARRQGLWVALTGGEDPWRGLHRPPLSLSNPRHLVAVVVLALSFLLIFGGTIFSFVDNLQRGGPPEDPLVALDDAGVFATLVVVQAGLFIVPAVAWAALLYRHVPDGVSRRLVLHFRRAWLPLAAGAGTALVFLLLLAAVLAGVSLVLPDGLPDNELALEIGRSLTLPMIVVLSLGAAAGEEIYFRSLLQKPLGVWGSALLFGLVHLTYWNVLQVVVPALLGVVMSLLLIRFRTVLAPFAAHFTFNFVQLLLIAFSEEGQLAVLSGLFFGLAA